VAAIRPTCIESMNARPQPSGDIRTTCPYCGVGCGIVARAGESDVAIAGDPRHPANFGKLCSKGSALGETLGLEGRLLHPMVRDGSDSMERTSWDEALTRTADGFKKIIERDGPDSVAFYLSGQLLTEDYYAANKLMKGFIGSGNADTNSRLCMASSVAGHRRAFGSDTVPGNYEDLDQADLIVLVGSNTAWCHPVLFQRIVKNRRERGAKVVVIDPRRTVTAEEADLFLPIAPGMDTALFCGLLVHLADRGALDRGFIEKHTDGFNGALHRAREIAPDIAAVARSTGISGGEIGKFFALFLETNRAVSCYSQGVNQSAQGTDKVNAIINCHLATGRIGRPGMGPFSLTGQPNAMGGRETGGLANQLAAHMYFSKPEIDRVRRFWNAPSIAEREGLKAVQMFEAIERREIKALWIMATNPVVSMPRAKAALEALKKLELLVISENVISNDTVNAGAHVLFPAAAWGEKDGTVTNSERRISRQRAFLPLPGEARPDWWIVSQVAAKMGFGAAFSFASAADVFREHAALSTFENNGSRDFDLGGLSEISDTEFEALEPTQWPVRKDGIEGARFFASGKFFTADRKARFVAPEIPSLRSPPSDEFPLTLNTGRVRDQWHTMTRSGKSPRLGAHLPEPYVEVHPADAEMLDLRDGGFALVETAYGESVLKVAVNDGQREGSLFAPIHWSGATSSSARIGELVAPATDPFSGQPELKATPARISAINFSNRGFLISRDPTTLPVNSWWAKVSIAGGIGYLLSSNDELSVWRDFVRQAFGSEELAEYIDDQRGIYRAAAFAADRLKACLFIGLTSASSQWDCVKAIFEKGTIEPDRRRQLLSGKSMDGAAATGTIVCACFGVGILTIREAIASGKAMSVEEIGSALRAGTNCGSCLPELRKLVAAEAIGQA
jgi:assimilatory nitrate reductase catalytic subunit